MAVHRGHAWAAHPEPPDGPWFTDSHVRHPLTGDLLPVWVADWVRPDFGTGAVLVNPAHDPVDLAFGRAIGLPIRFALVPPGYDGSPATWPTPPLVRAGQTIRTGPHDGLTPAEAAGRYFDHLAAHGLAERHRDIQPGRQRLGRLVPDPSGGLAWSPGRATVVPPADGALRLRLDGAGLLSAALAAGPDSRPVLVCPAGEQVQGLLALRLLWFDLAGRPLAPAAVHLVQKVQETKVDADPEVARLAAWLGAPLQQVAVVRQQTVEQVQRFLRLDRELRAQAGAPGASGEGGSGTPALAKVKAAIRETDPAQAFTLLLQAQKQLLDLPDDRRSRALPGYLVLAAVLTGRELPPGLPAHEIWEKL